MEHSIKLYLQESSLSFSNNILLPMNPGTGLSNFVPQSGSTQQVLAQRLLKVSEDSRSIEYFILCLVYFLSSPDVVWESARHCWCTKKF